MQPHHSPLSNTYVLLSIFGMIAAAAIWSLSPSWGFLILLFSVITFLASFISAVRAPLKSDEEIELAIHERYHGRRYPDTGLHHGQVPRQKKYLHTRHKKRLVHHHVTSGQASRRKASSKRKSSSRESSTKRSSKKSASKKSTRKTASRTSSKRAETRSSKRTKTSSRKKR